MIRGQRECVDRLNIIAILSEGDAGMGTEPPGGVCVRHVDWNYSLVRFYGGRDAQGCG